MFRIPPPNEPASDASSYLLLLSPNNQLSLAASNASAELVDCHLSLLAKDSMHQLSPYDISASRHVPQNKGPGLKRANPQVFTPCSKGPADQHTMRSVESLQSNIEDKYRVILKLRNSPASEIQLDDDTLLYLFEPFRKVQSLIQRTRIGRTKSLLCVTQRFLVGQKLRLLQCRQDSSYFSPSELSHNIQPKRGPLKLHSKKQDNVTRCDN